RRGSARPPGRRRPWSGRRRRRPPRAPCGRRGRSPRQSAPSLDPRVAAGLEDDVAGEGLVLGREVGAEVRATALAPGERGLADEARKERGRPAEALEALGGADHAGVLPELAAQRRGDGRLRLGRGRRAGRRAGGLAERRERRAPAEDEALE